MSRETEVKETTKELVYHSDYTGDTEVTLNIQTYQNNGRIFIGLVSHEEGDTEPFGDVTVNIGDFAPDYCGYLDTNNLSNVEEFITENDLGEFTGFIGRSGYCQYPLYMFNVDKLRELCPEQMDAYERSIGVVSKEQEIEKSR